MMQRFDLFFDKPKKENKYLKKNKDAFSKEVQSSQGRDQSVVLCVLPVVSCI